MQKKGSITLLIIVSVISVLILSTLWWLQRQPRLYVQWIDLQITSGLHFATITGEPFVIHDILVNGVFRPTLTDRQLGHRELRGELIYPIHMTPRTSFIAALKVIDTGDTAIQSRCFHEIPQFVLIRTSRGDYTVPLPSNEMKTVFLHH